MPKIDYDETQDYLETLVPPREAEIKKMEDYANENGFPIIGPVCGYYCYQLARMINAKSVFELGSGYGYSTAWFAKAVKENGGGVVHHTVWDDELSKQAAIILIDKAVEQLCVFAHHEVGNQRNFRTNIRQLEERSHGNFQFITDATHLHQNIRRLFRD